MFSQTYGLCATTRQDAQLSSRVPSQQNPTMLSAVGSPAMGAYPDWLLCADAELRKRIGGAARDYVMAHHNVTACAGQWRVAVAP